MALKRHPGPHPPTLARFRHRWRSGEEKRLDAHSRGRGRVVFSVGEILARRISGAVEGEVQKGPDEKTETYLLAFFFPRREPYASQSAILPT